MVRHMVMSARTRALCATIARRMPSVPSRSSRAATSTGVQSNLNLSFAKIGTLATEKDLDPDHAHHHRAAHAPDRAHQRVVVAPAQNHDHPRNLAREADRGPARAVIASAAVRALDRDLRKLCSCFFKPPCPSPSQQWLVTPISKQFSIFSKTVLFCRCQKATDLGTSDIYNTHYHRTGPKSTKTSPTAPPPEKNPIQEKTIMTTFASLIIHCYRFILTLGFGISMA